MVIEAIYDNGVLRPLTPVPFADQERVTLTVVPESGNWLDRDFANRRAATISPPPSLEEVRRALSKIKGSMDDAIDESRGDW